ncbi:MAG: DnaJ domain-containing protein [Burkholderiaceae bacterium]
MRYRVYYEIPGVGNGVTQHETKRAYRKLARETHPDVIVLRDSDRHSKGLLGACEALRELRRLQGQVRALRLRHRYDA